MPRKGGQATVTGIDFEIWFVASKIAEAFFDESLKVRPQANTYTDPITKEVRITAIDDVCVLSKSKQEFYNVKFRAPDIKSWKISDLKKYKVLQQIREQFKQTPGASLYFVTRSPCPIFDEILPRGANCKTRKELEIILQNNKYIEEWNKLQKILSFSDVEMIEFAKRVRYKHIIDVDELRELIKSKFTGHITNLDLAPDCLYQLAIESAKLSKTITKIDVIDYFAKRRIQLKSHLRMNDLLENLKTASQSFDLVSSTFFNNVHIEREEVNILLNWINTSPNTDDSQVAVLAGKAGCGKTVVLKDLLKKLQDKKIPFLGLKTDLLVVNSMDALKNEIELRD